MPHTLTAKKRLRQSKQRFVINRGRKREIATRSKKFVEAVTSGQLDRARELLDIVVSKIDKASKKNIIHRNKAARMKSRLARVLESASKPAAKST